MLCECGCGQDAGVYSQCNSRLKGQPKRFILYHKKKQTHCKRGHELTEENKLKSGQCRTCDYERKGNRKQRRLWKSQGLCNLCGKCPPAEGFVACAECMEAYRNRRRIFAQLNPVLEKEYAKKSRSKIRVAVLIHYSKGVPTCACCGETTTEFLCIDHINGGGNSHRKQGIGSIYPWLALHDFPEGFQVLCHNCNSAKSYYGICPHQQQADNQLKGV